MHDAQGSHAALSREIFVGDEIVSIDGVAADRYVCMYVSCSCIFLTCMYARMMCMYVCIMCMYAFA